jgi:hypothetical protein
MVSAAHRSNVPFAEGNGVAVSAALPARVLIGVVRVVISPGAAAV